MAANHRKRKLMDQRRRVLCVSAARLAGLLLQFIGEAEKDRLATEAVVYYLANEVVWVECFESSKSFESSPAAFTVVKQAFNRG